MNVRGGILGICSDLVIVNVCGGIIPRTVARAYKNETTAFMNVRATWAQLLGVSGMLLP